MMHKDLILRLGNEALWLADDGKYIAVAEDASVDHPTRYGDGCIAYEDPLRFSQQFRRMVMMEINARALANPPLCSKCEKPCSVATGAHHNDLIWYCGNDECEDYRKPLPPVPKPMKEISTKETLENSIPVFMKFDVLNSRSMSTWTEQEIMEYAFMTGQGWFN